MIPSKAADPMARFRADFAREFGAAASIPIPPINPAPPEQPMRAPEHARAYIGGGNIGGILGLSPFRTPLDEYHTIIGDSPALSAANEAFFKRRKALEPFAAAIMEERGFTVIRQNERYTDIEVPFLRAEIDAETARVLEYENAEFKSVHPLAAKEWGLDGDSDSVPGYITAQALWGLGISRRKRGNIVAVIGFDDARVFPVERAEDVFAAMRAKAIDFWHLHVMPRVPPAPSTVADVLNWITPDPAKIIEATDSTDLLAATKDWLDARDTAKSAEATAEALKARIQLAMSDATTLTIEGKPVITWKQNKDSIVLDHRAAHEHLLKLARKQDVFAADHIVASFTNPKAGARVFRVVGRK